MFSDLYFLLNKFVPGTIDWNNYSFDHFWCLLGLKTVKFWAKMTNFVPENGPIFAWEISIAYSFRINY